MFRSRSGVYSTEAGVESESKISDSVHLWSVPLKWSDHQTACNSSFASPITTEQVVITVRPTWVVSSKTELEFFFLPSDIRSVTKKFKSNPNQKTKLFTEIVYRRSREASTLKFLKIHVMTTDRNSWIKSSLTAVRLVCQTGRGRKSQCLENKHFGICLDLPARHLWLKTAFEENKFFETIVKLVTDFVSEAIHNHRNELGIRQTTNHVYYL